LIVTDEPSHDTLVEPSGLTTTFMAFSVSAARRSSFRRPRWSARLGARGGPRNDRRRSGAPVARDRKIAVVKERLRR
jgi:hypothetical protein